MNNLTEFDNVTVNLFNDGTVDVQTWIEPKEVGINERYTLRDCYEMRPDGSTMHLFPFFDGV